MESRPEQTISTDKSKDNIATHLIGDWIIRESRESFRRKENERFTPNNQPLDHEKRNTSNESIISFSSLPSNVKEWTVSFFLFTTLHEFLKQVTNEIVLFSYNRE